MLPIELFSLGDGYRMELAPESRSIEVRMLGKAKEAKLSQSHVETLAIVAYHQPITAQEIQDRLCETQRRRYSATRSQGLNY